MQVPFGFRRHLKEPSLSHRSSSRWHLEDLLLPTSPFRLMTDRSRSRQSIVQIGQSLVGYLIVGQQVERSQDSQQASLKVELRLLLEIRSSLHLFVGLLKSF